MVVTDTCVQVLCRVRCLNDCADALVKGKPLPSCIGFVAEVVEYKPKKAFALSVHVQPSKTSQKTQVQCTTKHRLFFDVDQEEQSEEGRWVKLKRIVENGVFVNLDPALQWVALSDKDFTKAKDADRSNYWKDSVDHVYARNLGDKIEKVPEPTDENSELLAVPKDWSLKHDRALIKLLANETWEWKATDFVESIEASTNNDDVPSILREDLLGWCASVDESHLIINMKKNTVVRSLSICFRPEGVDAPLPSSVTVYGGGKDSQELLNRCNLESSKDPIVTVLSGQSKHFPVLKLEFVGYGIIVANLEFDGLVNGCEEHEFFTKKFFAMNLAEVEPILASFERNFLKKRLTILQRVAELLDSILTYIIPVWEQSPGSFSHLKVLQELLPLSKKQKQLVKHVLRQTADNRSNELPFLYIKRNFLNSGNLDAKETVFSQIYEGLVQQEASKDRPINYRASSSQWWKCAFIGEGVNDCGGGFRDTVSNIAEELCPSEADSRLVLPFFIPCGNQQNPMASNYQDAYYPNPSCKEFQKYEWIGKLMGACLRSDERLTICLSPFFWKMLAEVEVTWLDYMSIDEAQVKAANDLEKMDEVTYADYFGQTRTWAVALSDGTSVPLKPNGDQLPVTYAERLEYAELVKKARMNESKLQVDAIRKGLLQVVPKVLLWLFSPDELEMKICGSPEITFEDLKKYVIVSDRNLKVSESMQYLWIILENFTNAERSQFLRFSTGRRRLPSLVYVAAGGVVDKLPTAGTCAHHFYLPVYSSFETADKLIRLAISSCKLIDTDGAVLE